MQTWYIFTFSNECMYECILPRLTHSDIKTVCTKKTKFCRKLRASCIHRCSSCHELDDDHWDRSCERSRVTSHLISQFRTLWAAEQKLWGLVWQSFAEAEQKFSLAKVFCDVTSGGASLAGNASIVLYNRSLIRHFVSAQCIQESRGMVDDMPLVNVIPWNKTALNVRVKVCWCPYQVTSYKNLVFNEASEWLCNRWPLHQPCNQRWIQMHTVHLWSNVNKNTSIKNIYLQSSSYVLECDLQLFLAV